MDDYGRRLSLRVASQIQELRQERGISLDQLGLASGLHATSIGLAVRGKRGLTLASAAALCRALGVSLAEMVGNAEAHLKGE